MKNIVYFFAFYLNFCFNAYAQDFREKDLIGKWEFIGLYDANGKKHNKIPMPNFENNAVEKVNRDSYEFKENREYRSNNPLNVSTGYWFFDFEMKQINLELRIDPNDRLLPSLKKAKIVSQRKDGFYYQKPVKKQLLYTSKDSITIVDTNGYYLVYKKE